MKHMADSDREWTDLASAGTLHRCRHVSRRQGEARKRQLVVLDEVRQALQPDEQVWRAIA
jgi:hypothetical protein